MSLRLKSITILAVILISTVNFVPSVADSAVEPLPLKLLGTIVESDSTKSIAVIKNLSNQRQGVHKLSDKILGYQIVRIGRGRVSLLKKGKISFLDFPLGSEFQEPILVISPDKRIINRGALAKKFSDLNSANRQIVSVPYIEAGKIVGFKIAKLKDGALAKMVGIKEGDIITKVNGERLSGIRNTLEIYSRAKDQDKINVEIKRGGRVKNLVYYIN